VLRDPVEDLGKAEFVPVQRAVDERMSVEALDLDVKAVASQEDIGGGEGDALIAVEEAVIVAERLHQRSRFFFDGVVVAGLRTKNSGWRLAATEERLRALARTGCSGKHSMDRLGRCWSFRSGEYEASQLFRNIPTPMPSRNSKPMSSRIIPSAWYRPLSRNATGRIVGMVFALTSNRQSRPMGLFFAKRCDSEQRYLRDRPSS
jgi:hypothetical protein